MRYRTFKRSARNFEEFGSATKHKDRSNLTEEEAKSRCACFNNYRTPAQIEHGTKLEFESY